MFDTVVAVLFLALNRTRQRLEEFVTNTETGRRLNRMFVHVGARRGIARSLGIAMLLLLSSAAYSHSWYPKDCCSGDDCQPVPCDELVETRYGILWRGVVLFNDAQVKASQDQFCHVCAKKQVGTLLPYLPLCAFIQPSS
jgi:hypothetical protein